MSRDDEKEFLHDISSPVSVIQGGLEILKLKLEKGEIKDTDQVLERLAKLIEVSNKVSGILLSRKEVIRTGEN